VLDGVLVERRAKEVSPMSYLNPKLQADEDVAMLAHRGIVVRSRTANATSTRNGRRLMCANYLAPTDWRSDP